MFLNVSTVRSCYRWYLFVDSVSDTDILPVLHFCFFLLVVLQKSTKGSVVLDVVFSHVNLAETDYFGLRYCDRSHQTVSATKIGKKYMCWISFLLFCVVFVIEPL